MKQGQDLRSAIYWADRDLGGLFLSFPISTFGAALLIGLWDSLPAMRTPSDAPLWILLSVCMLLAALGMSSVRWARRGYVEAGIPQHAIQRRISSMWSISAILMIVAGGCVFGYIAMSLMGWDLLFPVERPLRLAITFSIYVVAGALLLGWSWGELREAGNEDADQGAPWFRESKILAGRGMEGVLLFVFGAFALAFLIGRWYGEHSRWLTVGCAAISGLGLLLTRLSRRHLKAAGLSPEEQRHETATTWIVGAVIMILAGIGALACVLLASDLLEPIELWSLGSAFAGYTATGLLLLGGNWRFRRPP